MGTRRRKEFGRELLELFEELPEDPATQENFERIKKIFDRALFLRFEGDHFDVVFEQSVTNLKFPHGFGFIPKDLWITSTIGPGSITVNYDKFDAQDFDFTIAGASVASPLQVRFFSGQFVD